MGYKVFVTHPDAPLEPATDARLAALSPDAARLGAIAAVLGPAFVLGALQAVSDLPPAAFAPAMAELVARDLIAIEASGYRFEDADARARLVATLDADDRRRIHAAAGRHLERELGTEPAASALAVIAQHFLAAEDAEPAAHYALAAGRAHAAAGDQAEAEALLASGLAVVKRAGLAAWRGLRLEYLQALGDVWRLTGRLDAAKGAYDEALSLAEALGEPGPVGALLTSLAQVHQGLDAWVEAERLADRATVACLRGGDRSGAARALLTAARIRLHRGRLDEAASQAARAMAIAREADDTTRLAEALALVGYLHTAVRPKRLEEGVACLHESIAILSAQGDNGGLLLSYMLLGNAQLAMGDAAAAARAFAIARWIAEDTGNASEEGIALINLSLAALEAGRLDEAAATATDARRHAETLANDYQAGLAAAVAGLVAAHRGRVAEAVSALAEADALRAAADAPYMAALVHQWAQEARLLLGDLQGAKREGAALAAVTEATGQAESESRAHALMAETLGRLGQREAAMAAARSALAAAEESRAQGDQVRALRVIAWLMAESGDRTGARRLAETACGLARRLAAAYQVALLEGLLAELNRREAPDTAHGHWTAMRTIAEEMNCPPLSAQALAGLGQVDAARALLDGLLEGVDATNRQHFLSFPERRRLQRSPGTGPLNAPEGGL